MALKDGTPEDYKAAAIRHYQDSITLREAGQFDNSGHLIGFAAECAIKFKIGVVGQDVTNQHLPELIAPARKRLGTRVQFSVMYNVLKGDILSGWAIDHRYSASGKISEEALQTWHQQTGRLFAAAGIKARAA